MKSTYVKQYCMPMNGNPRYAMQNFYNFMDIPTGYVKKDKYNYYANTIMSLINVNADRADEVVFGKYYPMKSNTYSLFERRNEASKPSKVRPKVSNKKVNKPNTSKKTKVNPVKINSGNIVRFSGSDRIGTAIKISQSSFNNAYTIVIANSRIEVDALGSSTLASLYSAPVLLSDKNNLDPRLKDEIIRLGAKNVIVVGGEASISSNVVDELNSFVGNVERIAGKDRFDTSASIYEKCSQLEGFNDKEVLMVSGINTADALSVSSLAVRYKTPILLTKKDQIPQSILDVLSDSGAGYMLIAGGVNSVSDSVLRSNIPIPKIDRISGSNRYETAIKIAKVSYPESRSIIVANGYIAADALAAGAVTSIHKAPIILIDGKKPNNELRKYVSEKGIDKVIIVGGENSISKNIFN